MLDIQTLKAVIENTPLVSIVQSTGSLYLVRQKLPKTKNVQPFENESTYIPVGLIHALENPDKLPLEMIEVHSGSYLGEDDIVRFVDIYGRVTNKAES